MCRAAAKPSLLPFRRASTLPAPLGNRRTLHSSEVSRYEDEGYPLPWVHSRKPVRPSDPYLHRLVGLFLLKRVANLHGHRFSASEFLDGVRDAVYSLAEVMVHQDRHSQLEQFLGPRLHSAVSPALASLPEKAHIHLDIESIRNMHLSSVNAIVGEADLGDDHVISWLGQRVITSQSRLQNLMDEESRFTLERARELGREATLSRLEFRLGVSFGTKEKFAVLDEEGHVVIGSNQFRNCYHLWTLSSLTSWETEEYPFQWTIVDVNDFVKQSTNR